MFRPSLTLAALVLGAGVSVLPGTVQAATVIYNCQGGASFNATFNNAAGTLTVELQGGVRIVLNEAVSGSGVRYTGGGYEFYGKGAGGNLIRPGQSQLNCQEIGRINDPAPAQPQYQQPRPAPPAYQQPRPAQPVYQQPLPAPPQYQPPVRTASPSFNCGGRLNATEARICSNSTLADLDRKMASTYAWLRGQLPGYRHNELKRDQKHWLGQRNRCGSNDQCIQSQMYGRIDYLNKYLAQGQPPAPYTPPVRAASPSFNCGGRLNATETRICSNPVLADLDRRMASTYAWLRAQLSGPQRKVLKRDQKNWLARRNQCSLNDQCIESELYDRTAYLNEYL